MSTVPHETASPTILEASRTSRRVALGALAAIILGSAFTGPVQAQDYPNRPIRLVVPFAIGGGVDIVARIVAPELTNRLGKPVVVENKTGAGGNVGSAAVAKSEPNGYTLLMAANPNATNGSLYANMPYNPARELTPVALVATVPMVLLATPTLPAKNVRDAIALAQSKPGRLNFGSGGNGTAEHLAYELFKRAAQIDAQHVPYRGGAPAVADLISGQIQLMIMNQLASMPLMQSGQVHALGITSSERSPQLPDLPTVAEQGVPGFSTTVWWGIMGPAAMPKDVVDQINQAVGAALQSADVKKRFESLGAQTRGGTPDQFAAFFASEISKWATVIQAANIKLE